MTDRALRPLVLFRRGPGTGANPSPVAHRDARRCAPELPVHAGETGYWNFRDRLAGDLRSGALDLDSKGLLAHAHLHYRLDQSLAAEWIERFLGHVQRGIAQGRR